MAVTHDDFQDFHRFVDERIAGGGADSLRQLVDEWEHRRQIDVAIRQGLDDIDANRTEPFFESQDSFREERGLPPRQ